jgi:CheY-like chemotaxis protein
MLQRVPGLELVSEASDGIQAIRLAWQFQPDLIVLDIGLPQISGIEAARQIRRLCPSSKILFMTENRSADIAVEALNTGAGGYVVKSHAASDLLPAIKAVLEDKEFISQNLRGNAVASVNNRPATATHRHEVAFYPGDISLVCGYARFIENALSAGSSVIVVITELHRASLISKLQADGVDIAAAIEQGRYVPLDASDAMTTLLVNDTPDPVRCEKVIGDLVMRAAKGLRGERARVMVCGEIAPTMLSMGKVEAAIQLEHMWGEITRGYGVHTLCGYLSGALPRNNLVFQSICAEHSAIHGRELRA